MTDDTPGLAGDDELLAELARVAEARDPVPERARELAYGLLSWRDLDEELAELRFDSALEPTGVRGLAWPRQLSFEARETSIEIEIDRNQIVGQVIPPAEIDVHLTTAAGEVRAARSDRVGHFRFADVPLGAMRITAVLPDGSVTTQWFSL